MRRVTRVAAPHLFLVLAICVDLPGAGGGPQMASSSATIGPLGAEVADGPAQASGEFRLRCP